MAAEAQGNAATEKPAAQQLVRYDAMCAAIEAAYKVDEVKDIRDKALAIETYTRLAHNTEAERQACMIRLRAIGFGVTRCWSLEEEVGATPAEPPIAAEPDIVETQPQPAALTAYERRQEDRLLIKEVRSRLEVLNVRQKDLADYCLDKNSRVSMSAPRLRNILNARKTLTPVAATVLRQWLADHPAPANGGAS